MHPGCQKNTHFCNSFHPWAIRCSKSTKGVTPRAMAGMFGGGCSAHSIEWRQAFLLGCKSYLHDSDFPGFLWKWRTGKLNNFVTFLAALWRSKIIIIIIIMLPPPPPLLLLLHPWNYRNFWEGTLTKNNFQIDEAGQQRAQTQTIYGPGM